MAAEAASGLSGLSSGGVLGAAANALAVSYALGGQALGIALLDRGGLALQALGVLVVAHSMVIGAYLIHEAVHDSIFTRHANNRRLGELSSFFVGSAYASFERIRKLHLRHHRDRRDVGCFDYKAFLARRPAWVTRLVLALEWAYVPAVELIMHASVIVRPFVEQSQRRFLPRVLVVLLLRAAFWAFLAYLGARVVVGYCVAYALFIVVLQFFDAFHHTYDQHFVADANDPIGPRPSREYERANTYSNVISVERRWLNLLTLNFGYHNAHHEFPSVPWYGLPALHARIASGDATQVLPFAELLRTFHRNRAKRVLGEDYGSVGIGPGRADGFVGAHGVSFLTVV